LSRTDARTAGSKSIFSRLKNKLLKIALLIVKIAAVSSFFIILVLLSPTILANLQYYGVDAVLDQKGKSSVKYTFTFDEPVKTLNFTIVGQIEDFQARSIAGLVNCSVSVHGVSNINCDLPLTQEKRTVEMDMATQDFTKSLGKSFLFLGDFSVDQKVDQFTFSLTLPEGMALSDTQNSLSFPENSTKVSDGRHIIIIWKLENVNGQSLSFQALYEPVQSVPSFIWYFVSGAAIVSVVAFFIVRKIRKPEEVILSVLDDYERNVVKTISEAGGEINQRKIVQQTNLSKAKVSRVVKALEERGIVIIERLGRTNKVKLVKKKLWTR
jgi:predicted transcriptional regulator